jgi:hypothetical protein
MFKFLLVSTVCFLSAISKASAFVASPPPSHGGRLTTTTLHLYQSVQEAIAEAQRICAADASSPECKVAWDIVEELEAADSHKQKGEQQPANQSMDFVALMGSFDILSQKIDGKMDQLIATCDKFETMGADPSVAELSRLANEMKQGISYVNNKLRE